LINGGIYLMHKDLILESGMHGTFSLEKDIFPGACSNNIMMGVEFGDYFLDIGIPADLDRAKHELPSIG
jgi:NDP-sugar pyrophosphorylase family protein